MRIIHTADWHLGKRLGWQSRDDDLERAVAHVEKLCRQHAVDVLLVAGDIFDGHMDPETLRRWTEFLAETFREFLRAGGTMVAITGNHESEHQCQTLRSAMQLAAPREATGKGVHACGRLYLTAMPMRLTLADREGTPVQFLLMPYPTPSRYRSNAVQTARGRDAQRNALLAEYRARLAQLLSDPTFDPAARTVLAAHIGVAGALLPNRCRLDPTQAMCLSEVDIGPGASLARLDYVALGDIHLGQSLFGQPHIRYSGSPERMDLGESTDTKHVVLLDVGPTGLRGPPVELTLPARAVYEVRIDNWAEQSAGLAERYPDHDQALVKLTIHWRPGQDNIEEIKARLEETFPHVYNRDCLEMTPRVGRAARTKWASPESTYPNTTDTSQRASASDPSAVVEPAIPLGRLSIADIVREYLAVRLAGPDTDPDDREELLRLAEQFITKEGLE